MKNLFKKSTIGSLIAGLAASTAVIASADNSTEASSTSSSAQQAAPLDGAKKAMPTNLTNDQGYLIAFEDHQGGQKGQHPELTDEQKAEMEQKRAEFEAMTDEEKAALKEKMDANRPAFDKGDRPTPSGLIVDGAVKTGDAITVTDDSGNQVATYTIKADNDKGVQLVDRKITTGTSYKVSVNGGTAKSVTASEVSMPEPNKSSSNSSSN